MRDLEAAIGVSTGSILALHWDPEGPPPAPSQGSASTAADTAARFPDQSIRLESHTAASEEMEPSPSRCNFPFFSTRRSGPIAPASQGSSLELILQTWAASTRPSATGAGISYALLPRTSASARFYCMSYDLGGGVGRRDNGDVPPIIVPIIRRQPGTAILAPLAGLSWPSSWCYPPPRARDS